MVAEACRTIPKLYILEEAPLEENIWKLDACVRDASTEMTKLQFELNLKIRKLKFRVQASTPPEVKEQREETFKDAVIVVDAVVMEWTVLFEQSLEVFMSLQEDPNL